MKFLAIQAQQSVTGQFTQGSEGTFYKNYTGTGGRRAALIHFFLKPQSTAVMEEEKRTDVRIEADDITDLTGVLYELWHSNYPR